MTLGLVAALGRPGAPAGLRGSSVGPTGLRAAPVAAASLSALAPRRIAGEHSIRQPLLTPWGISKGEALITVRKIILVSATLGVAITDGAGAGTLCRTGEPWELSRPLFPTNRSDFIRPELCKSGDLLEIWTTREQLGLAIAKLCRFDRAIALRIGDGDSVVAYCVRSVTTDVAIRRSQ
jgi:hypothetical protein